MMRSFCICSWTFGVSFSCLRKFQKGQLFFLFSKGMLLSPKRCPFADSPLIGVFCTWHKAGLKIL